MAEQNTRADRAAALANRLRLLQVDFADGGEDTRRDYLGEEVRRALGGMPASERQAFLDEVQAHFPTWDGKVDVRERPAAAPARSAFDEKELKDPSFLVTRLIEACADLPEPQRRAIAERLHGTGLAASGGGQTDVPPAVLNDLRAKLQIGPRDGISVPRAMELLVQVVEFVLSLDQIAWLTWRKIAPQSSVRKRDLKGTMQKFVVGDPAVGRDQLTADARLLRQLVGALIGTLGRAGGIALQHFRAFSPEDIKVLVGPKLINAEAAYWRRYVEIYGSADFGSQEDAIRAALAVFAEALIQGAH